MDIATIAREDSAKLGSILLSTFADEGMNLILEATFTPGFVAQQLVDYLSRNGYSINAVRLPLRKNRRLNGARHAMSGNTNRL